MSSARTAPHPGGWQPYLCSVSQACVYDKTSLTTYRQMLLQSNALTTATVTLASIAATMLASVDLTAAALTKAVTFDGSKGTTFQWRDLNDPVMGGRSFSTFHVDPGHFGVFNGTCAIVPSLKAPGFAKITTDGGQEFADLSEHIEGYMELSVRSTTPGFKGCKLHLLPKMFQELQYLAVAVSKPVST